MNCKTCGAPMAEGERFCGSCGAKAEPEKKYIYCINCGEKLEAGTQYCENCGASLGQEFDDEPVKAESGLKKGLMIAIIVVLVLVIIGCGVLVWDILAKPVATTPVQSEAPISTPAGNVTGYYSDGQPLPTAPPPRPQTGYLFNSDTEYITESYLNTKTKDEVRLILNEIYAKNGYIFSMEEFRNYFMAKPWYTPVTTSAQEAESRFNSIERANKETITKYEQSMGWR